jgi:hypothetical protein
MAQRWKFGTAFGNPWSKSRAPASDFSHGLPTIYSFGSRRVGLNESRECSKWAWDAMRPNRGNPVLIGRSGSQCRTHLTGPASQSSFDPAKSPTLNPLCRAGDLRWKICRDSSAAKLNWFELAED